MSDQDIKPWYQSKGVIGGLVAVASVVAGAAGYNLSPDDQEAVVLALSAVGSAVGALLSVYGRLRANRKIG